MRVRVRVRVRFRVEDSVTVVPPIHVPALGMALPRLSLRRGVESHVTAGVGVMHGVGHGLDGRNQPRQLLGVILLVVRVRVCG